MNKVIWNGHRLFLEKRNDDHYLIREGTTIRSYLNKKDVQRLALALDAELNPTVKEVKTNDDMPKKPKRKSKHGD